MTTGAARVLPNGNERRAEIKTLQEAIVRKKEQLTQLERSFAGLKKENRRLRAIANAAKRLVADWDARNVELPDNGDTIDIPTTDTRARDLRKAVCYPEATQ